MKTILLHGLGQTPSSWDSTIQFLEQQSEIIVPDLFSFIKGNPVNYESLYSAFAEYCIHFHEPLNLCGLSLGGILALRLAIEHPEVVHSLILIGARYNVPKILFKIQNGIFKLMPDQTFEQMGMAKRDFISLSESMTDIDLENGYININNQVIQDKNNKKLILSSILKTSTSKRSISMPKLLINHLEGIRAQITPNKLDYVILNRQNEMCNPRNISMEFTKKVAKYPNINQISIHSLRHTHATLLIFNGENIKVISDRLGHKDISVTLNTYTHVMEDMKKDTALLLDSIFK